MTKEELKQEAQEYYEDETEGTFQICEDCYWFADAVQTAYVDSAEPREKRIAELEQKLEQTEKDLAKAKELLERLLITSCNSDVLNLLPNCSEVLRVRVEAEQFLIGPDDRFEVTEKGKEYLNSH